MMTIAQAACRARLPQPAHRPRRGGARRPRPTASINAPMPGASRNMVTRRYWACSGITELTAAHHTASTRASFAAACLRASSMPAIAAAAQSAPLPSRLKDPRKVPAQCLRNKGQTASTAEMGVPVKRCRFLSTLPSPHRPKATVLAKGAQYKGLPWTYHDRAIWGDAKARKPSVKQPAARQRLLSRR